MRIEDYKLKIKVSYSRQAKYGRGNAVFNYTQSIMNYTSFDFNTVEVRYHGETIFTLRYKRDNYFILADSTIKDPLWIKFPRGPTNYQPWILATLKEMIYYLGPRQKTPLNKIITDLEKSLTLPNIVLEIRH